MRYHCSYGRKIKELEEKLKIHRMICRDKSCRHTDAILPDFLIPHKQYSANEVEAVLLDSDSAPVEEIDTPASISTARRWIRQIGKKISEWFNELKSYAKKETSDAQFKYMPHMERLSLLLEKLPPIRNNGNVLSAALVYLTKYRQETNLT